MIKFTNNSRVSTFRFDSRPLLILLVLICVGSNVAHAQDKISIGQQTDKQNEQLQNEWRNPAPSSNQPATYATESESVPDPLEAFNRKIFWFNDKLDTYFLEPVATVYDSIIPDPAQRGVNNFFANLKTPVNFLSDVVQLEFGKAGIATVRFLVNTSAGIGGILDVAKEIGLERDNQDFGSALGHWGVGTGPYLVLPVIGPSSIRDGFGLIVDAVAHPTFYLSYVDMPNRTRNIIKFGARGLEVIQTRADLLEAIKTAKEGSVDYYTFVRSSYSQRRKAMIRGELGFEDEEPPPGAMRR